MVHAMTGVPCMTSPTAAMADLMVVPLMFSVRLVFVHPPRAVVVTLGTSGTCGAGANGLIVMAMLVVCAGLGHQFLPQAAWSVPFRGIGCFARREGSRGAST